MRNKIIIYALILLIMAPWQGAWLITAHAQTDTPVTQDTSKNNAQNSTDATNTDTTDTNKTTVNTETEDDAELPLTPVLGTADQIDYLNQATETLDNLQQRRSGDGQANIADSLPRIGMSQCDQLLVQQGLVDQRLLEAINYLVRPTQFGGAGMTYLQVTFAKSCEGAIPDSIGGAYPVNFPDDSPQPPADPRLKSSTNSTNNNSTSLNPTSLLAPLASEIPGIKSDSQISPAKEKQNILSLNTLFNKFDFSPPIGSSDQNPTPATYTSLADVILPTAQAATVSSVSNEPQGATNVHNNGLGADITAAGLVMCQTKSGGVFGLGRKTTNQAPRPIKVSWQTDKGVSDVQTPFGANFDQMAETAGLDNFLAAFTAEDGSFRSNALTGAFTMMGFNYLASLAGVKPGSFDPSTAPLNYQTLGYALLADAMNLPDASVFNPLIGFNQVNNPFDSSHDNTERLLKNAALRVVEKDLKLPSYSLDGANFQEVLANSGMRRIEQMMHLQPGSLPANLNNIGDTIRSIGMAQMDTVFHWPVGTTTSTVRGNVLDTLTDSMMKTLNLPAESRKYADTLVRGSFKLPSDVSIADLVNKDSGFWRSDRGAQTRESLKQVDQQIIPNSPGQMVGPIFSDSSFGFMDSALANHPAEPTYSLITGQMSLNDEETLWGAAATYNSIGAYQDPTGAFGLPENEDPYAVMPDGTEISIPGGQDPYQYLLEAYQHQNPDVSRHNYRIVTPPVNDFLTQVLKGEKNHIIGLGVDAIMTALGQHPDERVKQELVPVYANIRGHNPNGSGVRIQVGYKETLVGGVADALAQKLQSINFSSSKANLSMSFTPADFLMVIGKSLATDSSDSQAKLKSDQRFQMLASLGKEKFGNLLSAATQNAIGDSTLTSLLFKYDQKRASTHPQTDTFDVGSSPQTQFTLTQQAISVQSVAHLDREGAPTIPPTYQLSSDKKSITVPADTFSNSLGGDKIVVTYTTYALRSGQQSQLSPDLFVSLLNDKNALTNLALQYGAAKVGAALNLPPSALMYAAGIINTFTGGGIASVGQATLEQAAGLDQGALSGSSWPDVAKKLTATQINQIFRLDTGWYDKIISSSFEAFQGTAGSLADVREGTFKTDDFYKLDAWSTLQLLTGKINFDQYKKRIGNVNLKYNLGGVLASTFNIDVAGYKLNALDFTDLISGSMINVMGRIGARLQEKNHGLPVNSLAQSLLSGKNDVSLWVLGTNIVATTFHLNSINLSGVNSIGDLKNQVGLSTIEQALGFKAGTFKGSSPMEIAASVGMENFVNAFRIALPAYVKTSLSNIKVVNRQDLAQQQRDKVISDYINTLIGPGVGDLTHFPDSTSKRFDEIDHIFNLKPGSTLAFMQSTTSVDDYIKSISSKAVESGITGTLANALGIKEEYAIEGKKIIDWLKKPDDDKGAYLAMYSLVQDAGGLNFDSGFGFDKGTTKHLIENFNDVHELKRTFVAQGTKKIARYLGLNDSYLQDLELRLHDGKIEDFQKAMTSLGEARVAQFIDTPGYTSKDASYLIGSRFAGGVMMAGAALMSKSDEMKKAGITYVDIRNSIVGDPDQEKNLGYITFAANNHLDIDAMRQDAEYDWLKDDNPMSSSLREGAKRAYMQDARQAVSYKFIDYQAHELLPPEYAKYLMPGFAQALIGGKYTYTDSQGKKIPLTGDAARWRYAKDFLVSYSVNNLPILRDLGVPSDVASTLLEYATTQKFNDKWLETQLTTKDANGMTGIQKLGTSLDKLVSKVFDGVKLPAGTGNALIGYAFDGNIKNFGNNIWTAWQGSAFSWADKALGFQSGTVQVMYNGIVGYQSAMSAYTNAVGDAYMNYGDTLLAGGDPIEAGKIAQEDLNTASRQLKTQTAMIIATVANIVFQKQFSQIEGALGIQPGTLIYLIQFLIHPDPISLGLFIFFNFIWGKTTVTCNIDTYSASTPDAVTILKSYLTPQTQNATYQTTNNASSAQNTMLGTSTNANANTSTVAANKITVPELTTPKPFNGANNDAYRKGIEAGAKYEVRRVIGSLLLMPIMTGDQTLKPKQIVTLNADDVSLFENISSRGDIYGPLLQRSNGGKLIGPFYDQAGKMTDRIHLGY